MAKANPLQKVLLTAVRLYQKARLGRPSPCRFMPSCSEYTAEAIESHGPLRGVLLASKRILKCNPFGPSGIDPVPPPKTTKETTP